MYHTKCYEAFGQCQNSSLHHSFDRCNLPRNADLLVGVAHLRVIKLPIDQMLGIIFTFQISDMTDVAWEHQFQGHPFVDFLPEVPN